MNILQLFDTNNPTQQQQLFMNGIHNQNNWTQFKKILNELFETNQIKNDQMVKLCCNIIQESPTLIPVINRYYIENLESQFLQNFIKKVSHTSQNNFQQCISLLCQTFYTHQNFLNCLEQNFEKIFDQQNNIKLVFQEKIKFEILKDPMFNEQLQDFFEFLILQLSRLQLDIFKRFILINQQIDPIFFEQKIVSDKYLYSDENFTINIQEFQNIFRIFNDNNLIDELKQITFKILTQDICQYMDYLMDKYDYLEIQFLDQSSKYANQFGLQFAQQLIQISQDLNRSQMGENSLLSLYSLVFDDINQYINDQYIQLMIQNIFEIILQYPESYKVILDIKQALMKTFKIQELGEKLSSQIVNRLLIPGVMSQDILTQYINLLKILQIIDSEGLIFDKVTAPIKKYLLGRSDTLRCIISHLTEDSENYTKLVKEYVKIPFQEQYYEITSDEDEEHAEKWEVHPQINQKTNDLKRIKYQESDLVTVLVNLYGSQEAFLQEYQSMLGEKLLSTKNSNIDEEIKNIELLKLRFGESNLQNCNIIIKDVKDSKRLNTHIHQNIQQIQQTNSMLSFNQINVLFVSKGYWPINYDFESFEISRDLQFLLDDYETKFKQQKYMRKLIWHNNLGFVDLTLTFDNGPVQFRCLPIHAHLIQYFDESKNQHELSCHQLAQLTRLNVTLIRQKMTFWFHKKVIMERKISNNNDLDTVYYSPVQFYDKTQLIEDEIYDENNNEMISNDSANIDFSQNSTRVTQMIEGLIISMLYTNGPKNPTKIHQLLKTVYKPNIPLPISENYTKDILQNMIKKQKLAFNGVLYSISN